MDAARATGGMSSLYHILNHALALQIAAAPHDDDRLEETNHIDINHTNASHHCTTVYKLLHPTKNWREGMGFGSGIV